MNSAVRTATFVSTIGLAIALGVACGGEDPKKPGGATTASATATVSAAPEPPRPKTMPELLVDSDGPYLGGMRIRMNEQGWEEKLKKRVSELPIEGKPVTLLAEKKAKIPHVAAVVTELGRAGAPRVILKTDGRNDLPKELTVTPEPRISGPAGCSIAAMVLKDLSTAIWPIKGGTAKQQRKGLAGPDLSHTSENLKKDLVACDSTSAFFSSDETLDWEMAYNLAGTIITSDEKKKIDALVLLAHVPVAGRPVEIGKNP